MPQPARQDAHVVSADRTLGVARLALQQALAACLTGVEAVRDAVPAGRPIAIYDIAGPVLFHDYLLEAPDGRVVGSIRTAANRALGSPLISIAHAAPGWSRSAALRKARESLHADEPTAEPLGWRLVCYAYPKIGVEVTFRTRENHAPQTAIFDAASGGRPELSDRPDESAHFTAYSLLELVDRHRPGVEERVAAFRAVEARVAEPEVDCAIEDFWLSVRSGTVRLSPYCPNSPIGLTHYAQITNYFCVDASAQMLMEHYGWNYTQNQIAVAMGTTAAQGGTSGAGLVTGFASLTHNSLTLGFDDGATRAQQFGDAVTEIDHNRPLFTQVPHHYRVCVGYFDLETCWLADKMLYIYDPWPWSPDLCSPGAAYWEAWDSSPVMWFGIVHHA